MSGPVRPPLTVAETDGTPTIRPCNTITFNSADFVVIDNGATARIDLVPGGGAGASLASTMIGFGDVANLLTGDSVFTYTTPGSLPTVTLGDSTLQDAGGNFKLTGKDNLQILTNSTYGSIKFYPATGTTNALEIAYTGQVTVNPTGTATGDFIAESDNNANMLTVDASQDNIGIGGAPDSDVERLHVQGTAADANDPLVRFESTDAGTAKAPILEFYRNSASPADSDYIGAIHFSGNNVSGTKTEYGRILSQINDISAATEDAAMYFQIYETGTPRTIMTLHKSAVVFNENQRNIDFRVESDNNANMILVVASQDNIGIGGAPDSDVERLHVKGTGDGTLVRLESTDTGAGSAPELNLYRSATATTDDLVGQLRFQAKSATGSINITAATIYTQLKAVSGTAMDSAIHFDIRKSNSSVSALQLSNTASVFNAGNVDIDFRIETTGATNMFVVDAGQDNVGIGTSPDSGVERLHIKTGGNSTIAQLESTSTSTDATVNQLKFFRNATGVDGNAIGGLVFDALDDGDTQAEWASIKAYISDASAGSSRVGKLEWLVRGGNYELTKMTMTSDEVVINEGGFGAPDFRVESDGKAYMLMVDASANLVGIGAAPAAAGPQFQVNEDASFSSYLENQNTSGIVDASLQKNGHVVSNPAGGDITVTLGTGGSQGEKVTITNVSGDSSTVTLAVAVGDSTFTTPAAFSAGDSQTWLCYKDLNWIMINSQT